MKMKRMGLAAFLAFALCLGCGDETTGDFVGAKACTPRALSPCHCTDGWQGFRQCDEAGNGWGECQCDGGDTDIDANGDTDTGPGGNWVGTPCDPSASEDGMDPCPALTGVGVAYCFRWSGEQAGICTRQCNPATSDVPVDGCDMDGIVCMDISSLTPDTADDEVGHGICLEKCIPSSAGAECKASYIRCDPESWSSEAMFATCLLPKCQGDSDCGVVGRDCADDDAICDVANGETCRDDGAGTRRCVFDGACDMITGRCSWTGDKSARIGDPCESTSQCGDNMECLGEDEDADGGVLMRNGMCIKRGCAIANQSSPNGSHSTEQAIADRYGCPLSGVCDMGFVGGVCLLRCLPDNSSSSYDCRQHDWSEDDVLDLNGDYECYDQTAYVMAIPAGGGNYPVADAPFCIWVSRDVQAKCTTYELPGGFSLEIANDCTGSTADGCTTCDTYYGSKNGGTGLTSWGEDMKCRNPVTGALQADGYCLDNTTSGSSGGWDTDTSTDTGT
jgi:hypothetical protein